MSVTPKQFKLRFRAKEFVPGNPDGHDTKNYELPIKTPPKGNDINPEEQHKISLTAYLKAHQKDDTLPSAKKEAPKDNLEEIYGTIKMLPSEEVKKIKIVTLMKLMRMSRDKNDNKTGRIISNVMQGMLREGGRFS
jgi:hypothetical protein